MAQLALGIAGAVVGFWVGGPMGASIGFALGSALGGMLDPPKVEGPKLTDLKLQHSTYGAPIPVLYGTVRVAGNCFWQTDLQEHKQKSGGKGGGPSVTSYTYSASFAILLCRGEIVGLRRIWADGRLIWDGGEASDDAPFVLYYGTETQLPDPTIEAEEGVGEVPAHRGYAYIVFTDLYLTDYGNRIPSFQFEIEATGGARLDRISTWTVPDAGTFTGRGLVPVGGTYLSGGAIVVCVYTEDSPYSHYQEFTYAISDGSLLSTGLQQDVDNPGGASTTTWVPSCNSNVAVGLERGAGSLDVSRWYVRGVRGDERVRPPVGLDEYAVAGSLPFAYSDYLYMAGSNAGGTTCFIGKWAFYDGHHSVHGTPETEYFDLIPYGVTNGANIGLTVSDDGYLYAIHGAGGGNNCEVWKIDISDMSLVEYWAVGPNGGAKNTSNSTFTVYRGLMLVCDGSLGDFARLYQISGSPAFQLVDSEAAALGAGGVTPYVSLGGGYIIGVDGVMRIGSSTNLGDIVYDICLRCGMDGADVNVADLTDPVRGYMIAAQMTGRNAIEPLRAGFFFDGAEVDDQLLFKHRDGDSVATIYDEDLGAREAGSEPVALLELIRTPDNELPHRVNVNHYDVDLDYQQGTQYAGRLTGGMETEVTLNLPIVFSASEAKAVAETQLYLAAIERESFKFRTTRKWEKLVPSDVVTLADQQREVRIVGKASQVSGVIEFTATVARAIAYTQETASGVAGAGGVAATPQVPPVRAETLLVLLDIPMLSHNDYIFGFYAAMCPSGSGSWPGATLMKSVDNGTTYNEIASASVASIIGTATTALGSGGSPSPTVRVVLSDPDATLSSCTQTALDNGANLFALKSGSGWELAQFKTATLVSAQTYDLSEIDNRGVLGTDAYVSGHAVGDRFVVLPVTNVDAPQSELNVPFLYKAVTWGATLASATAQTFTNTGESLNTYVPIETSLLNVFVGDVGSPTDPKKGLVPAPEIGMGVLDYVLLADGTWGLPSWAGSGSGSPSGGSGVTDGDKGDITVSASGTVWAIDTAAIQTHQLDVNVVTFAKMQDINENTLLGRTSWGGSPVVGDVEEITCTAAGRALLDDADAAAQRTTLGLGSVATHADSEFIHVGDAAGPGSPSGDLTGTYPSPSLRNSGVTAGVYGSTTEVAQVTLDAQGRVTAAANVSIGVIPSGAIFWFMGGGQDGAMVLDGTNTFPGLTLSGGNTYVLTAPICATDLTINSGITLTRTSGNPASYMIYCTGTLTNNGSINMSGRDASGTTGGGAWTASGTLGGSNAGANGRAGAGAGNNVAAYDGRGGKGGAGGAAGANAGGTTAAQTAPTAGANGWAGVYDLQCALHGVTAGLGASTLKYNGGSGGGGGAVGAGGGTSGAGGAGGAPLHVVARYIAGSGSIFSKGGNGSNGSTTAGHVTGGGGGGGGGVIQVVTTTANWQSLQTVSVAGGAHGNGFGGGSDGVDGDSGRIIEYIVNI